MNSSDETIFEIGVYFVDTTYGRGDHDDWQVRSAALKQEIEQEFGLQLDDADIAPGWSLPAFSAIVAEYWPAGLVALALAGEKIEKNVDAWVRLYDRIKHYLKRLVCLDRNGASVLAVNEVIVKCGATPRSLRFEGYAYLSLIEGKVEYDATPLTDFLDPPAAMYLSVVVHIFQIEADNRRFKVYVEGNTVHSVEISTAG